MTNDNVSLSHTKWNCKYHIVFAPKYRRQEIYGRIKADIGKILRQLCEMKGVEIIEAEACPDSQFETVVRSTFKTSATFHCVKCSDFLASLIWSPRLVIKFPPVYLFSLQRHYLFETLRITWKECHP